MVETQAWKKNKGLTNETYLRRLCGKFSERVLHLALGCQLLAEAGIWQNNNVLKILMTACAKNNQLLDVINVGIC